MVNLNNKTILVTGGCGFIGSNFIEYINKNYNNLTIVNIDKWGIGHRKLSSYIKQYNKDNNINNSYYEYAMSICSLDPEQKCFINGEINSKKFDYIFHFAAESHVDRSISGPSSFIENNVMGMTKLLEMVRISQPQARMINISTDEVFGHLHKNDPPFTEKSHLKPRSPYSSSKAAADLIANSYVHTYDLDIITTHCCNNFGPHQADEKFIPTVVRSIMKGELVPIYGTGENIREWIHVDDHNKSILEIAEHGKSGLSYNIGSGVESSNLFMVVAISGILGIPEDKQIIKFIDDRKGHDFRYAIESIRYKRTFELKNHKQAMEETVKFYKKKYDMFNH